MKYTAIFITKNNQKYSMVLTRNLKSAIAFCVNHIKNNNKVISFKIEGVEDIDDDFTY